MTSRISVPASSQLARGTAPGGDTSIATRVAEVGPDDAERLPAALGPDWYADPAQISEAIRRGRSFNLIYIPQAQKIDIFPVTEDFQEAELARASAVLLPFVDEDAAYPVASAEDILLAKLRWYAEGGERSERQWKDITAIVAMNPVLDSCYLDLWAARFGLAQLLARAIEEGSD